MLDPKIRQLLLSEAGNYLDRDAYISDLSLSSIWEDEPDADIPPERVELLGHMYDIATATIPGLIDTYGLTQTNFARYFNIPLRTVQDWCRGERECSPYVVSMAAEILSGCAQAAPQIRQLLLSEAGNYLDRDAYISDLSLSSIWEDEPDADIPPERVELLGRMYDIATATIPDLLGTYSLTQTNFARYFDLPLRTVQNWCEGQNQCPQYVVTMAAEILSSDA